MSRSNVQRHGSGGSYADPWARGTMVRRCDSQSRSPGRGCPQPQHVDRRRTWEGTRTRVAVSHWRIRWSALRRFTSRTHRRMPKISSALVGSDVEATW